MRRWSSKSCSDSGAWFGTTRPSRSRARHWRASSRPSAVPRAPGSARASGCWSWTTGTSLAAWRDRARELEPWFESAPAHILVLTREADTTSATEGDKLQDDDEIEWPVPFWFVDAGAALMLVSSLRSTRASRPESTGCRSRTRRAGMPLGIPADLRVVAGATVGRPLPDPEWSKVTSRATQRRRTLEELVRWNRWSE